MSDGQKRFEKGVLTQVGDAIIYEVVGSYSFLGTDGKSYHIDYTSGVNGYKATATGKCLLNILFKLIEFFDLY